MAYTVCIDPGHGGSDPGAVNPTWGYREKDLALDMGLKVREILQGRGVNVVMTREGDYRSSDNLGADLSSRAWVSNNAGCDAFVSIHLNSAATTSAYGTETYSYNGAYTPELAQAIHNRIIGAGLYRFNRGTKVANFAVLRETDCIAALVETAFINNDEDCLLVVNNKDKFANAIADGICDYLGVAIKEVQSKEPTISDMPITGKNYVKAKEMAQYALNGNPNPKINCKMEELAQYFLDEGAKENIRGDIAFCQSLLETGFFRYGGQVLPEQNNFAGIGATNNSPKGYGAWFKTPQEGVRAQIQHLKAYANDEKLKSECVDPRFHLVTRGKAPTWCGLSGKWAVPGYDPKKYASLIDARKNDDDYGTRIIKYYLGIRNSEKVEKKPEPLDNTPDGWAASAIEWAKEKGLLVGNEKGDLMLHKGVTRQELYSILERLTNR